MKGNLFRYRLFAFLSGTLIIYGCSRTDGQKQPDSIKVITEQVSLTNSDACRSHIGVVEESESTVLSFPVSEKMREYQLKYTMDK